MTTWQFIKYRTADADGAVWRSEDGTLFKRTGGPELHCEAGTQRHLTDLGYPVPEVASRGRLHDGTYYFTEHSAGTASLHEMALADTEHHGQVSDQTIDAAVDISSRLLAAQARHPRPTTDIGLRAWFEHAAFADNVYTENPDLHTDHTRALVDTALTRLREVPMCESHLDYGMPNAFPGGVIDWQHQGPAPLGYDVYPMLDIAAFKGGNRGYQFTPAQRIHYTTALDQHVTAIGGRPLSEHLGDYLLVKCFFFLALMRPANSAARPDKYAKWQYRRALFSEGLAQYEQAHTINTAAFPTLADFTSPNGRVASSSP
ncbi:phosphotransferase [Actinacidiphila glaucinigra]|uniref:phosphotransferase n=1 Tax=Actinacidiphila glaucinigra TaxID=235986 RepID=UPI0035DDC20E